MKILITGASGFVGSSVLHRLKESGICDDIIALSSVKIDGVRTIDSCGYKFSPEYLKENGCADIDTVLHIGAFTPKSSADANNVYGATSNISSTECLILSNLPSLRQIVFTSTLDVYEESRLTNEETNAIPQTLYGWSKLYCEEMIKAFCKMNNLSFRILRLGHIYGEGEENYRKVIPITIKNAIEGNDLNIFGDGEAKRSFIYIDDVAIAIVKSLFMDSSEIINIVGNEPITINELTKKICSYSNNKLLISHIPIEAKNRDYLFDNSKMLQLLIDGFTPLDTGLKREYEYMKGIMKK